MDSGIGGKIKPSGVSVFGWPFTKEMVQWLLSFIIMIIMIFFIKAMLQMMLTILNLCPKQSNVVVLSYDEKSLDETGVTDDDDHISEDIKGAVVVVLVLLIMERFLLSNVEEDINGVAVVAVVDEEVEHEDEDEEVEEEEEIISTGFLERFLPLCICLSQYLESGYASGFLN
ncbi:hypothetical protein Q3G72_001222 [Acer saccharum]|nr:hypothetical protein Q3G72_001222 [Acer saccharum]